MSAITLRATKSLQRGELCLEAHHYLSFIISKAARPLAP